MRRSSVFVSALLASASSAFAITVDFTADLNGANERPTPIPTSATGTATGQLNGDPGAFVFTYHVEYTNLSSAVSGGHIHRSLDPVGALPTEQTGAIVHPLDSLTSPIDGDWRFDDVTDPLTDDLATALQNGELYVNIHSDIYPDGEIRGQWLAATSPPPPPPPPPSGIPLPPGVYTGFMTMAAAGWTVWRTRVRA